MADPIYDTLKLAIISPEVLPGSPLRQDEIARSHSVRKIPVREALLQLEVGGFVTFLKNEGATVRELSSHEILNLTNIRPALECNALELAIPTWPSPILMRLPGSSPNMAKAPILPPGVI